MIVETRKLLKRFGDFTAVDHLDLAVPEGICFGLLGPNGAGKTTTIEMLEGIVAPTSGTILFRGEPVSRAFRERIGIQFQSTALPDFLRVGEVLKLFHSFYRRQADLRELIRWCDLGELLERDANKLSGGQRQRLLLALALVNDPELVFLDEPTTGLDPEARRNFWDLVRSIRNRGKTILLTTHYMDEAYELCDDIGIMNRGQIVARGDPDQLLSRYFEGQSILLPRENLRDVTDAQVSEWTGLQVFEAGGCLELQTDRVNETIQVLIARNISLNGIGIRSRNLEDLFLELTRREREGRAQPDGSGGGKL